MLFFYNFLQVLAAPIAAPFLLLIAFGMRKYRYRTPARLGYGLHRTIPQNLSVPIFWIHALSIGETTSAIPLIDGLKARYPECTIIFSVTTRSGRRTADSMLQGRVDCILDSPFDLLPVVRRFIKMISPGCFILIETDFWPNLLYALKEKGIPIILVNGRVSDKSMVGYKKMKFFFKRVFLNFDLLCCQTEVDRQKLHSLGVPLDRLHTLGNLKFDTAGNFSQTALKKRENILQSIIAQLPPNRIYFIAGSTHKGEEEILLQSFQKLYSEFSQLYLIIVPRNIERSAEIVKLCNDYKCTVIKRSEKKIEKEVREKSNIFILDTIGELAACYALGTFSFVGGSLIDEGGHNPIEPALTGQPVFFGQSMEDFSEISRDLLASGGAFMVRNSEELIEIIRPFLLDTERCKEVGKKARNCMLLHQGVIARHLDKIQQIRES